MNSPNDRRPPPLAPNEASTPSHPVKHTSVPLPRHETPASSEIQSFRGVERPCSFLWNVGSGPKPFTVVEVGKAIRIKDPDSTQEIEVIQLFHWGSVTLGVTAEGRACVFSVSPEHLRSVSAIPLHHGPVFSANGGQSFGLLTRDPRGIQGVIPISLTFGSAAVNVGPWRSIPFQQCGSIEVESGGEGICLVTAKFIHQGIEQSVKLICPEPLARALWQEWELFKLRNGVRKADLKKLYRQYALERKNNLLAILYSDILFLNQELSRGGDMEQFSKLVLGQGDHGFQKDSALRERVISKTLTLAVTLPRIKQKFELLTSLYPYYCFEQELSWLKSAFGQHLPRQEVDQLRSELIPAYRNQVRSIYANVRQSLTEIEGSTKVIDALLSKEEVESKTSGSLMKFLPLAAQGAAALCPGPTQILSAANFVASASRLMMADEQAASQIRRAAQNIFPWWQIFMTTLVVSIHETSNFITRLSQQGIDRDFRIFRTIASESQPAVRANISLALNQRILAERKRRFQATAPDAGFHQARCIYEIQDIVTRKMSHQILDFVTSMDGGHPPPRLPNS